jgi:hypothetical protein
LYEDKSYYKVEASETSCYFHCNLFPIRFISIGDGEIQGYALRLELIDENENKNDHMKIDNKNAKII